MSRYLTNAAALAAAVLIMTATFVPVVTVPSAQAAVVLDTPVLA
jgi:hypothetical protein